MNDVRMNESNRTNWKWGGEGRAAVEQGLGLKTAFFSPASVRAQGIVLGANRGQAREEVSQERRDMKQQ